MGNDLYIASLDGKDIFLANNLLRNSKLGYNLRNKKKELNLSRFINTLNYSLDQIKMREVHETVYRKRKFSFFVGNKEYTQSVINVTFKYNIKEFNQVKKNTFVKYGYDINNLKLIDNVCAEDGELLAIEIDKETSRLWGEDVLGKWFYAEDGVYKAKKNIGVLFTSAEIRSRLYKNGFICDGVKYIRFKRSSGSSRVGKCLFIDERLYEQMHIWEMCGIEVEEGQDVDLAALEPYIALTLSSIIDTMEIQPKNILVVDDYKSVFKEKAIATKLENGKLVSKPEVVEISNNIWDGQSLMDKSLFGKYEQYGMLLLRARFFKSCCFNTNIQKWFRDNGISEISQLNGKTVADKIEDIKLITTPSSIKYLKFGTYEKWLKTLEPTFGIVKHEKPTKYFNGQMIQTHYQLLNTLQMTYEEVEEFVKPSLDYLKLIKTDPVILRHYIKYHYVSDESSDLKEALNSRNDIIYKLLGINERFAQTKLYNSFQDNIIKSYKNNLRNGHVLVKGNYSTLLGNPLEMLKQSIGDFDGGAVVERGVIHSTRFEDGEVVLGSRSPHVTMGNVLLAKNTISGDICNYLNLTDEIVCVNSIGENILERLSGADFDSDTMLLTNNEILIKAAKRNYDNFPVPTKLVESTFRKRQYTSEEKADLDIKTGVNKIGEIINLSQELNSKLWDELNSGKSIEDVMDLYCDIAQLDVMSNLEIDSAKRENPADNGAELRKLKFKYETRDDKGRYIRPVFFKYIDSKKGYYDKERKAYRNYKTSMDYLQKCITKYPLPKTDKTKLLGLASIITPNTTSKGDVNYRQVKKIISIVQESRNAMNHLWDISTDKRNTYFQCDQIKKSCCEQINAYKINEITMLHLLSTIDETAYKHISRNIFDILFGLPNELFYSMINQSKVPMAILVSDDSGDIFLFDYRYKKTVLAKKRQIFEFSSLNKCV